MAPTATAGLQDSAASSDTSPRNYFTLLDHMQDDYVLMQAWYKVRQNGGCPGAIQRI